MCKRTVKAQKSKRKKRKKSAAVGEEKHQNQDKRYR